MSLSPLQMQGYNALVRELRAYERSSEWHGCLQCLAETRLARLTSEQCRRRAGLRTAYVAGEVLACRQFLAVPHSCDRDGMSDFLAGHSIALTK
jgi:hypothetical protein